jgi:hypothetical protein
MGWHQDEIGAMAFFSAMSDYREIVTKLARHRAMNTYADNDVQVLECAVLLGNDEVVCRLHAPRGKPGEKGGAERIADWVNSVLNDGFFKEHIRSSRTFVVGYEVEGSRSRVRRPKAAAKKAAKKR